MMGEFGGSMWMTSCRTTPTLSQLNQVFHPWRQQPQLILIPNQLFYLKLAHILLMMSYAASIIPLSQISSEIG